MAASGTYVVHPGYRGVQVTMGKVSRAFKPEGFGMKAPLITAIHPISIRQQTAEDKAECYSSDLQQIHIELRVLFRIPEGSVVKLFQEFYGDPFESLVAPRVLDDRADLDRLAVDLVPHLPRLTFVRAEVLVAARVRRPAEADFVPRPRVRVERLRDVAHHDSERARDVERGPHPAVGLRAGVLFRSRGSSPRHRLLLPRLWPSIIQPRLLAF